MKIRGRDMTEIRARDIWESAFPLEDIQRAANSGIRILENAGATDLRAAHFSFYPVEDSIGLSGVAGGVRRSRAFKLPVDMQSVERWVHTWQL